MLEIVVIRGDEYALCRPDVRCALVDLADLTEYDNLGGAPSQDLLDLVDSGDAFCPSYESTIRRLVSARRAQLEAWLEAPWPRALADDAHKCLRVLRAAGF